jgi:hypothetical protein
MARRWIIYEALYLRIAQVDDGLSQKLEVRALLPK